MGCLKDAELTMHKIQKKSINCATQVIHSHYIPHAAENIIPTRIIQTKKKKNQRSSELIQNRQEESDWTYTPTVCRAVAGSLYNSDMIYISN